MKFRIVKKDENPEIGYNYEVLYFDENDSRGPKWRKVIWDKENYLNFRDTNFTATVEEAEQKAKEFAEQYKQEHGELVKEFVIPNV